MLSQVRGKESEAMTAEVSNGFDIRELARMVAQEMPQERPELLSVNRVAELLDASPSHVYRLADAGMMPAPIKLGNSVKWVRNALNDWIAGGCKPIRTRKRV
jgi:excisionase family DNA binding protein